MELDGTIVSSVRILLYLGIYQANTRLTVRGRLRALLYELFRSQFRIHSHINILRVLPSPNCNSTTQVARGFCIIQLRWLGAIHHVIECNYAGWWKERNLG